MCGLYSFRKSAEEVAGAFKLKPTPHLAPRDYVAPGGPMAILKPGKKSLDLAHVRWGLVPAWVKKIEAGAKPLINARAETILEKPSFVHSFKRRRCLIPADGFYEWAGEPGRKQAFHIARPDAGIFAFAGIYDHWMGQDGSELETAAIITCEANRTIAIIHNRMPMVISPENYQVWLSGEQAKPEDMLALLKPAPDDYFIASKVEMPRTKREAPIKPKPRQLDLF